MKQYLFIFTISPVQSFIAQARKAQDLYAGSQILSTLVREGIQAFQEIAETDDCQIIFPSNWKEQNASLPNRFIAKIESKNNNDTTLKSLGVKTKESIKKALENIAKKTLENNFSSEAEKQIKRHLEVHWAALPIEVDYKTTYLQLESLLGAVKNIRPFEQLNDDKGEMGRKCNLDGENNALFYHGKPALIYHNTGRKAISDFILNPGEAISAVSFLKRKYEKNKGFPSVAEVALLEAIESTKDKNNKCLSEFKELCNGKNGFVAQCLKRETEIQLGSLENLNTNFDYQLIYPENITAKNFPHEKQREYATQIAEKLAPHLKDKHYALLMFDGDKMGTWLSGEKTKHDNKSLEKFHDDFSKKLSAFAKSVQEILKGKGRVIYAGGDDFLGMVNLHHLFEVMRDLREVFYDKVNSEIEQKKEGCNLTFSAGIVISHYKTPLSEVLNKVRLMEQKAKKEGDRNAFAISVIKHSGEVQEAVFKWDKDKESPNGCSNWNAIETVFQQLKNGNFSNKFITSLTREMYQIAGLDLHDYQGFVTEDFKCEIGRLLKKARITEEGKTELTNIKEAVFNLLVNQSGEKQIQNFIHALQIADFLQRRIQK